jgi:hypothetical protein
MCLGKSYRYGIKHVLLYGQAIWSGSWGSILNRHGVEHFFGQLAIPYLCIYQFEAHFRQLTDLQGPSQMTGYNARSVQNIQILFSLIWSECLTLSLLSLYISIIMKYFQVFDKAIGINLLYYQIEFELVVN